MTPNAASGRTPHRICARRGCGEPVKKATAKYCSVRCCTIDPERLQRLRAHARRSSGRALPMAHQLSLSLPITPYDPEAQLSVFRGREDIPGGMSRLAG